MALYEYVCSGCGARTEKRMPMADALQFIACPKCGKQASKAIGQFSVVGAAREGVEDGPAPWDAEGGDTGDDHGHSHDHGHATVLVATATRSMTSISSRGAPTGA